MENLFINIDDIDLSFKNQNIVDKKILETIFTNVQYNFEKDK